MSRKRSIADESWKAIKNWDKNSISKIFSLKGDERQAAQLAFSDWSEVLIDNDEERYEDVFDAGVDAFMREKIPEKLVIIRQHKSRRTSMGMGGGRRTKRRGTRRRRSTRRRR